MSLPQGVICIDYNISQDNPNKIYFKRDFEAFTKNPMISSNKQNNIEGAVNDELAIDAWERALELRFGKNDDAFFLLKIADSYERIGDFQTAKTCRNEASRISAEAK